MPTPLGPSVWRHQLQLIAAQPAVPGERADISATPRPRCANPSCNRGWLSFLKDHRRPIFEDRWACGAQCLRSLVDTAIRHESPATSPATETEHTHRVPLGLILLTRGWITQPQLQHALAMQRQAGKGRIGRWLMEECGIPERRILHALALQWHCDISSLDGFRPAQMALAAPRILIESAAMLPLRVSSRGALRLAFADRPNSAAALALERTSGLKVESGLLARADLRSAREALLGCEFIRCSVDSVPDRETLSRRITSDLAGMQPRASRLVRIQQFFWLRMWLEDAALRGPHGTLPPSREDMLDRIYSVEPKPS